MEYRKLELVVISASDLPNVRKLGRTKIYAKILIADLEWISSVDYDREQNPCWNFKIECLLPESLLQEDVNLQIVLYCERHGGFGGRYVGEVNIGLKTLFNSGLAAENKSYYVYRKESGSQDTVGTLNISYGFEANVKKKSWLKAGAVMLVEGVVGAAMEIILPGSSMILDGFEH